MKTILPVLAVLLLASCLRLSAAEHTDDSLDSVKQNLAEKKALLIDVREPAEWKRGHLKQAQLVPLSELKKAGSDDGLRKKLEKTLPKDKVIYCHCGSGVRVLVAADILGKLGYDIRPLAAGYGDLLEAGFEPGREP